MKKEREKRGYRGNRDFRAKLVNTVTAASASAASDVGVGRLGIGTINKNRSDPALRHIFEVLHAVGLASHGLERAQRAAVEVALREVADLIARELRVERVLLDD